MGEKWKALPKEERKEYQSGLVQPPYRSGRGGRRAWTPIDAVSAVSLDAISRNWLAPTSQAEGNRAAPRASSSARGARHTGVPDDLSADGEYVHPSYLDGDQHEMALAAATALLRPDRKSVV